jgi:hypothetical protein
VLFMADGGKGCGSVRRWLVQRLPSRRWMVSTVEGRVSFSGQAESPCCYRLRTPRRRCASATSFGKWKKVFLGVERCEME